MASWRCTERIKVIKYARRQRQPILQRSILTFAVPFSFRQINRAKFQQKTVQGLRSYMGPKITIIIIVVRFLWGQNVRNFILHWLELYYRPWQQLCTVTHALTCYTVILWAQPLNSVCVWQEDYVGFAALKPVTTDVVDSLSYTKHVSPVLIPRTEPFQSFVRYAPWSRLGSLSGPWRCVGAAVLGKIVGVDVAVGQKLRELWRRRRRRRNRRRY